MAQSNVLQRYLDAGMAFSAMTQAKAEEIVRDFVNAGEVQTEQVQEAVQDLLDRGRKNTEELVDQVSRQIATSAEALGLATLSDLSRIERLIGSMRSSGSTPRTATATSTAPGPRTGTARKSPAKKRTAKKTAAKKTPAKKTPAKKRATAKKATTRKSGAAKKTAAKKS